MAKTPNTSRQAAATGRGEGADGAHALSKADVAAMVKRTIVVKDGEAERTTHKDIAEDEVLAFRDYGSHVVVVTTDGQKFSSAAAAA